MSLLSLLLSGKGPMDGWIARGYDVGVQTAFREFFPLITDDILPQLLDTKRILDAGCGPGQFTILAAEKMPNTQLWGVDLAPTMIDLACRHAERSPAAERLHFQVADVADLPFADGEFDAIVSSGSIKHWPDPVAGLAELHRVLAPGGRAFIGEMNRLVPAPAIPRYRERIQHWFFRLIYPHIFARAMSPDEAHQVFAASPFGAPTDERLLLDGCFWMFEAHKDRAQRGDTCATC